MNTTFKSPYQIHKLQIANGCNIAYLDEGKGDTTLLFIHGLATYALSWRHNIEYLKQHFRCIALDLPGNGFSDRGDYPYGIDFFSGCVYDFMQNLKLKNVVLVGHSMGGQVVLNLAIKKPGCAGKLVLCAPAGFETFTTFERGAYMSAIRVADLFSSDEQSLSKTISMSFYHYHPEAERISNELIDILKTYPIKEYRRMIEACIHGMLHEPVFEELGKVQQPSLIIFGEHDSLIPNRLIHFTSTKTLATEGSSRISKASLEIIPRSGHFVQIEKAELVNQMIHQFVLKG
jgi:pimeloyl-ACP methyl ester carboxylesterase